MTLGYLPADYEDALAEILTRTGAARYSPNDPGDTPILYDRFSPDSPAEALTLTCYDPTLIRDEHDGTAPGYVQIRIRAATTPAVNMIVANIVEALDVTRIKTSTMRVQHLRIVSTAWLGKNPDSDTFDATINVRIMA